MNLPCVQRFSNKLDVTLPLIRQIIFYHAVESARITISVFEDCKDIDELYSRAKFINDAFQSLVVRAK